MQKYDVVIIGAGVAGLYLSKLLEGSKTSFITLDKRNSLGTYGPRIISMETLQKLNMPKENLVRPIKKINFYSPNETKISKESKDPRGYVVNLKSIEDFLFSSIKNKNNIKLGKNVIDFDLKNNTMKLLDGEEISFKVVVFATGVLGIKFRNKLGISHPRNVFCYAVEVNSNDDISTVIDNELAPGFYGWIIPLEDGLIEVGFGAEELNIRNHEEIKKRLMSMAHLRKYKNSKVLRVNGGFIPTGMINKKANNEWIVIGDAAGGEPMLGGSIHKCINEAEMAFDTIQENINKTYMSLGSYESRWSRMLGKDFESQKKVREMLDNSKNKDFDRVFKELQGKEIEGEGLINDLFRNIIINLENKI